LNGFAVVFLGTLAANPRTTCVGNSVSRGADFTRNTTLNPPVAQWDHSDSCIPVLERIEHKHKGYVEFDEKLLGGQPITGVRTPTAKKKLPAATSATTQYNFLE